MEAIIAQRWLDVLVNADAPPFCPRCGSLNGALGTSNAYFMCHDCSQGACVYYLCPDGGHPETLGFTWNDAIDASPWGRR